MSGSTPSKLSRLKERATSRMRTDLIADFKLSQSWSLTLLRSQRIKKKYKSDYSLQK
jgi:hypothetical protein